jgi:hypothetical protein
LKDKKLKKIRNESNYYLYYLFDIKSDRPKVHIFDKSIFEDEKYLNPVIYKIAIDIKKK